VIDHCDGWEFGFSDSALSKLQIVHAFRKSMAMDAAFGILLTSAVGIGFIHTLIGVDHSLPFVVLGRAQGWSLKKVLLITSVCGLGHVLSSVALGSLGITLGFAVSRLAWLEGVRGSLAAWTLIAFGLTYAGWSFARQRRGYRHVHEHAGSVHSHEHETGPHRHQGAHPAAVTTWSLFIIFVLGPCEPLIPLLMVPAMEMGFWAVVPVTVAFGLTTIGTMVLIVTAGYWGLRMTGFRRLEAHANVLAGLAIAASGLAIQILGI
jgi:sulfite exporter TauE/SafE